MNLMELAFHRMNITLHYNFLIFFWCLLAYYIFLQDFYTFPQPSPKNYLNSYWPLTINRLFLHHYMKLTFGKLLIAHHVTFCFHSSYFLRKPLDFINKIFLITINYDHLLTHSFSNFQLKVFRSFLSNCY